MRQGAAAAGGRAVTGGCPGVRRTAQVGERDRDRERESVCVCVCVCVNAAGCCCCRWPCRHGRMSRSTPNSAGGRERQRQRERECVCVCVCVCKCGRVLLLQVAVPSREDVPEYAEQRRWERETETET